MNARPRQRRVLLLTLLVLACCGASQAKMASEGMQEDAQLTDVMFIDQQTGWAVGDRGTIWHTTDGGAHWHLQSSGVEHRLESVQFIDESIGWAAGGFSHPYAQATSGIVLQTRDGGRHWKQNDKILLPYLRQIKFFDAKHGWAIGQPSAMFASGLFTTEDGGRNCGFATIEQCNEARKGVTRDICVQNETSGQSQARPSNAPSDSRGMNSSR